ncbi:MAG: hypothetical protein K2K19_12180, partial [Acetatifactor sp.]|nr:hypothetical protein [Acetatifactor sp.]
MIRKIYRDDEGVVCSPGCDNVNTMTVCRLALSKHTHVKTRLIDNRRKNASVVYEPLFPSKHYIHYKTLSGKETGSGRESFKYQRRIAMTLLNLFLIAVGLSMDAFAVS